jgi:septal ring factor EnvC (AmiA/AmiB activator)
MSMPACSCRVAWSVAALASITASVLAVMSVRNPPPTVEASPAAIPDPRVAEIRAELEETRRVLDDVQSAVAQRDREIAAAEDELRTLRKELETLRAKPAP